MHEDDLTPSEREAFAALPREAPASDLLEERTVRALAARGWIRGRRRSRILAWGGAAAACLLFFAGGFALGKDRSAGTGRETTMSGEISQHGNETAAVAAPGEVQLAQVDTTSVTARRTVVWF
jgi:hypothetical protein